MCGIAGIIDFSGGRLDPVVLGRMRSAIQHRGPDQEGVVLREAGPTSREASVGLAHARLSIIDLAGGRQPFSNAEGTISVVFNGEIYNFHAIREELIAKGYVFQTASDTECIVHAYHAYGPECVQRFRGMFAFALWDQRAQQLMLARDRLGKKPLVYARAGQRLLFASELQALRQAPEAPHELDLGALGDYLAYGYVPSPSTIYQGIRKVPPGHYLLCSAQGMRLERYWQLDYLPKLAISEADAVDELERRLREAVRLRLIADVPVGALLSGGVDSGLIVALMAQESGAPVKTFSIGFEDAGFDELPHARRVAQRYDTAHREFIVRADASAVLPRLVRHYGEPYADSSAVPSYYVSQLARQEVPVALNGDGGDELCAGYDRYRAMQLADALHRMPGALQLLPVARRVVGAGASSRLRGRAIRFLDAAGLPAGARYARWISFHPPEAVRALLDPSVADAVDAARSRAVEAAFEAHADLSLTDRLLATDVATYLPDDLLVKMDIASMANALETRSPLLDHEVVEFAARLPASYKLRGGVGQKHLLKRLARRWLPRENVDRAKQGFGVPVGAWLRGTLRERLRAALSPAQVTRRGLFDPAAVGRLIDEHERGQRDRGQALWNLLMLELWFEAFQDAPREAAARC